jgi:hypothetical protein
MCLNLFYEKVVLDIVPVMKSIQLDLILIESIPMKK